MFATREQLLCHVYSSLQSTMRPCSPMKSTNCVQLWTENFVVDVRVYWNSLPDAEKNSVVISVLSDWILRFYLYNRYSRRPFCLARTSPPHYIIYLYRFPRLFVSQQQGLHVRAEISQHKRSFVVHCWQCQIHFYCLTCQSAIYGANFVPSLPQICEAAVQCAAKDPISHDITSATRDQVIQC